MKAKQVKELLDTAVKNGGQVDENGNPDYVCLKESKVSPFEFAYRNKWNFPSEMNIRTDRLHLDCTKKAVLIDVLSARDCKLVHEDMTKNPLLCP